MRLAVLVLLAAAPAFADPSALEQAKAHFKAARVFQEHGEYAHAAEEYRAAYELDHKPEMLFNVAQAYRLAGDARAALDYYQQYLAAQPDGAGAREARDHVAELTKRLPAEHPVTPEPPSDPIPVTRAPVAPVSPPSREPVDASTSTLRIAGYATAGAGAIAIAAGVKFGLDARAAAADISAHTGPWTDTEKARFEDGRRANRNMAIAYAAGGALVVTGGVLFVLGGRAQVAPVVTASTAGAVVWGRF